MRRLSLLLMLLPAVLHAQVGIGQWRSHLAYGQVLQLCAAPTAEGTLLYAAAPQGLFTYDDAGGLLERLDKTSSLHDVGIATLAYDASTRCCVVAYSNANIDIISLADGRTHNISDLKRSTMSGDKSIHSIRFHDRRAYLAFAFGIVVIDLERHEI